MVEISASLLAADYARLGEDLLQAAQAGVDSFHFDFMDGHYVPNLALTPQHLRALRSYTDLPFHVHLELTNPDEILANFHPLGADLIFIQWDTCSSLRETVNHVNKQEAKVGLAINPEHNLEDIRTHLHLLDALLMLGVEPGFGGQTMNPRLPDKVAKAREMVDSLDLEVALAVDGGVKVSNAKTLIDAGATLLIMGTGLFKARDPSQIVEQLKRMGTDPP